MAPHSHPCLQDYSTTDPPYSQHTGGEVLSLVVKYPITTIPEHDSNSLATIPERCITFDEAEHSVEIPSLHDYSSKEIKATWYDKEDLFQIRQEVRQVVRMHRCLPSTTEMRGLEAETADGSQKLQARRLRALYSVLAEQERQWQTGDEDCKRLSSISSFSSRNCISNAFEMAKVDAANAHDYYHQSERSESPSRKNSLSCQFLLDPSRWFGAKNCTLLL